MLHRIAALLLALLSPLATMAAERAAPPIGVSDAIAVGLRDLPGAHSDGRATAPEDHGCAVTRPVDPTLCEIGAALPAVSFGADEAEAAPARVSGQGIAADGRCHPIPADADIRARRQAQRPTEGTRTMSPGRTCVMALCATGGQVTPGGIPGDTAPLTAAFPAALADQPRVNRPFATAGQRRTREEVARPVTRHGGTGAPAPFLHSSLIEEDPSRDPGGGAPLTPPDAPIEVGEAETRPGDLATEPLPAPVGWERRFGGADWDELSALAPLPDGGSLAAGYTESRGAGREDGWLLRLDAAGAVLWERTFGGADWDLLAAVTPLPDGGILAAGSTDSDGAGGGGGRGDGWILRLDAAGDVLWQRTLGGAEEERLTALVPLPDGGTVAAGTRRGRGAGGRDGWVVRLDAAGEVLWQRTLGGAGDDMLHALAPLPDGGVVAAGATLSEGTGGADGWVLRLDAAGSVRWERAFGGAGGDALFALAALPDGGFLAAGSTESPGTDGADGWLLRLDAGGAALWERTVHAAEEDALFALAALPDGGFLAAGSTESPGTGGADGWILRLDAAGALLWDRTPGGAWSDGFTALAPLPGGGFLVAGSTWSHSAGAADGWLLRLTAEGRIE